MGKVENSPLEPSNIKSFQFVLPYHLLGWSIPHLLPQGPSSEWGEILFVGPSLRTYLLSAGHLRGPETFLAGPQTLLVGPQVPLACPKASLVRPQTPIAGPQTPQAGP